MPLGVALQNVCASGLVKYFDLLAAFNNPLAERARVMCIPTADAQEYFGGNMLEQIFQEEGDAACIDAPSKDGRRNGPPFTCCRQQRRALMAVTDYRPKLGLIHVME